MVDPKGEIELGEESGGRGGTRIPGRARRRRGRRSAFGEIRQRGGKRVIAFAVEGDLDADAISSNTFEMEWPPKSGRRQSFPEVDRAEWLI